MEVGMGRPKDEKSALQESKSITEFDSIQSGLALLGTSREPVLIRDQRIRALEELHALYLDRATVRRFEGVTELKVVEFCALHFGLDPDRLGLRRGFDYADRLQRSLSEFTRGHRLDRLMRALWSPPFLFTLLREHLPCTQVDEWDPLQSVTTRDAFAEFIVVQIRKEPDRWDPGPLNSPEIYASLLSTVLGYSTPKLEAVLKAASLWRTKDEGGPFDPENPSTWPTNPEVASAVQIPHVVQKTVANQIAMIVRRGDVKKGRRPEMRKLPTRAELRQDAVDRAEALSRRLVTRGDPLA
jgi:hypothetical protein